MTQREFEAVSTRIAQKAEEKLKQRETYQCYACGTTAHYTGHPHCTCSTCYPKAS
jgi:hypothetical protein